MELLRIIRIMLIQENKKTNVKRGSKSENFLTLFFGTPNKVTRVANWKQSINGITRGKLIVYMIN